MPSISFQNLRKHKQTDRQENGEIEKLTPIMSIKNPQCNLFKRVLQIHFIQSFLVYPEVYQNRRVGMGFTSLLYNAHLITSMGVQWPVWGIGHSAPFSIEVRRRI